MESDMTVKSESAWKRPLALAAVSIALVCGNGVASGLAKDQVKAADQGAVRQDQSADDDKNAESGDMIQVPASCMEGYERYAAGQYAQAIELYERCIGTGTLNAEALGRTYRNIGIVYRAMKRFETSILYFDRSLKEKPFDPWSDYVNQGNSYSDMGQYDQALRLYDKAEALNPNMGDIAYNRGIVYERKGDIKAAIDQFFLAYDRGLRSRLLYDKLVQYDLIESDESKP
jgi:tetratricopeptide (TPR) repeat protein